MTLWSAFCTLVVVTLLASFLGFMVRCKQERLVARAQVLAVILFPIFLLFVVISPIPVAVYVLSGRGELKKFNVLVRTLLSVFAIPIVYVLIIGSFEQFANETIWSTLVQQNKQYKQNVRATRKLHKKSPDPRFAMRPAFVNSFSAMHDVINKLGTRVEHGAFMSRVGA